MRRLSQKAKIFASEFVRTQNGTEAALAAFTCKNRDSASVVGSVYLKKPEVRAEVERLLQKSEISPELVSQKIREGLDANVVSDYRGDVEETEVPDMSVRHKYVDTAAKIMDLFPPERKESRSMNVDIELEKMNPEQIKELLKGLNEQFNKQLKNATISGESASGEKTEGGNTPQN